jgi:Zinc dependent phospholipase C
MRNHCARALAAAILALTFGSCYSWGLRTHLWVGQQVIDDVIDDCNVDIVLLSGPVKKYPVTDEICNAIRTNPEAFRAGNLGPDSFPDPVVGQMTTHPGVDGGWATDRWLLHVLNAANSPDELAFAYGFVSHAAADVFAHSYVNHYAGDVFILSDGETAVEFRHFALEKYIESKTPIVIHKGTEVPLSRAGISVPKRFLSTTLIYNESVAREYFKVKFGLHLSTLHVARGTVQQTEKASQAIVDDVAKLLSEYFKLQADQLVGLQQAELGLKAAQLVLKGADETYASEEKLLREARNGLRDVLRQIEANEDFILAYPGLLSNQLSIISNAVAEAAQLRKAIAAAEGQIGNLQAELNGILAENACKVVKEVCGWVEDTSYGCVLYPPSCVAKWACEKIEEAVPRCDDLRTEIAGLTNRINSLRSNLEKEVLREAGAIAAKAALEARKVEAEGLRLSLEASRVALEIAIASYEWRVAEARKAVALAQSQVAEMLRLVREAKDAVDLTKRLIGQIEDFAKRYNVVTLFLRNWLDGIDRAGDDYIDASLSSTLRIMSISGDAFEPYKRWLQCSLMNYLGVPWQLPFAYCDVKDKFNEIVGEIDKLKESLPPILQWVIDPMGELQEEILKKAKPEVWKAVEASVDFVLKPPAGRFVHMLADPKLVTPETLQESYNRSDTEGKNLIRLPNVVGMVNQDMALSSSGELTMESFHALRNSVVLAKLSLLNAAQLNLLFKDLAGDVPTRYGPTLYGEGKAGRFTLLIDAVRSIDGNHQWQPFGLPYPRSDGTPEPSNPDLRRFGHSVHDHPHFGLRIFADPTARKEVFHRVFSGPIEGSLMLDIIQLKYPPYTHPACAKNPFPRTIDDNGAIENLDLGCISNVNPAKWFDSLGKLIERVVYWFKSAN